MLRYRTFVFGKARERIELWCERRCSENVRVYVVPYWWYYLFEPTKTLASSSRKQGTITIYVKALLRFDWQHTLEHELLHIQFPQWSERKVETIAHRVAVASSASLEDRNDISPPLICVLRFVIIVTLFLGRRLGVIQ